MNLKNRTALVTGSSRCIGRAIVQKFATAGARVAVNYHQNQTAAEKTFNTLASQGHILIQADVTNPIDVKHMVDTTIEQFERLDILVNNAGATYDLHPPTSVDYRTWLDSWQRVIQTNLLGAANACYCAAQYMIEQRSGRIINVGSRGAYRGEPSAPGYGASKAGLHSLSQSLAQCLGQYGIIVTAVAPGPVQTEMIREILDGAKGNEIRNQSPLGRVATPEEVAHIVLFLAAPGSEMHTGGVVDLNGASYLH